MSAEVDKNTFPGAVTLVARHGRVLHFEAAGFSDAAKTKPLSKDAIFRLASMTKPIVTVAGMMLVEQGVMKLNDPIILWLPELKDLKVETPAGDVPLEPADHGAGPDAPHRGLRLRGQHAFAAHQEDV